MKNFIKNFGIVWSTFMPLVAMLITGGIVLASSSPSLVYADTCTAPNTPPGCTAAATTPTTTPADNKTAVCNGIGLTGSGCDQTNGPSVDGTVKLAISFLSFIVGIAAVIMVMVGGFKYITSSGDSNNISSAKNTILYAIIGLVVAVLAQIIVRFVLNQAAPVPAGH